jgi:hypothetical protein
MDNQEIIRWSLIIGIPLLLLLFYKFILRVSSDWSSFRKTK